uniref:Aa_trans domain-containing protein n=1 Tax=Panagrellus redivivus TaxID=6233 RepID=A0A7E4VEY9_PANRE
MIPHLKLNDSSLPSSAIPSPRRPSTTSTSLSTPPPDSNAGSFWVPTNVPNAIVENGAGLSWFVTGLFIVADIAGGGIVALPTSMVRFGITLGIVNLLLMFAVCTATAVMLGHCWRILLDSWPQYKDHCRKPYPEIAFRAFGPVVRTIVSACINISQFLAAVVFLLLSSKNIQDFIKVLGGNLHFCIIVIVLAIALLPLTFLKSPQDFWGAVIIAMVTTTIAVVLLLIGISLDSGTCVAQSHFPQLTSRNYFSALGTFLFAFGGHSAFPTIQHDMKRPAEFWKSSIVAFIMIFTMYLPVCIFGYYVYGDSIRESIINSIQRAWIQQAVNVFITLHCILTLTIIFNPLNQEVEELCNVPHHFGWKRVAVRTGVMVAVVFVAESVPAFESVLDFVGGTTIMLTSIVFPALFYLKLRAFETRADIKESGGATKDAHYLDIFHYTPAWLSAIVMFIVVFGLCSGAAATYAAINNMVNFRFQTPCYVEPFIQKSADEIAAAVVTGVTNCCGRNQDISVNGMQCSAPDLNFYTH